MHVYFKKGILFWLVFIVLITYSCQNDSDTLMHSSNTEDKLFSTISSSESGIYFQNKLVETEASNYYKYMYSYIGAGVAVADFNNDDLEDLFFVSNQYDNILYINKGDLEFEDVTTDVGIQKRKGFDVGVTIVDINNDGLQDIYITRGGWITEDDAFANILYVNDGNDDNGIPSFTERAAEYNIDDKNRGIHSVFFDYDRDGDLDLYISNSPDFDDPGAEILDLANVSKDPITLALKGSDKLYENEGNGSFADVSIKAGILPDIGFGLHPQVGDLNEDGWLDIYVCNDFRIPDFAYINNQDGTFSDQRAALVKHMSFNSMGGDIADVNNDGLPDLYTLDMNPEDYIRSKTTMGMTSQSRFEEMVDKDYHYQYMHNMLQLNNGNGSFREIANLAGVANTDWSWSCLLADFDLDGYNDILVTNGVFRDVIDRDANAEILQLLRSQNRKPSDADFLSYAQMLPQQKLENYLFKNNGDLSFEDVSSSWTQSSPSFSNGAAYADLDNDGDLEIVINNINEPATLLKNNAVEQDQGEYLQIQLTGPAQNRNGIGTSIKVHLTDNSIIYRQLINSRGFLSSVSSKLHIGLHSSAQIEKVEVIWPDGRSQALQNVEPNQLLQLNYQEATEPIDSESKNAIAKLFKEQSFNYSHLDPVFDDYSLQVLLPHKLSQLGPAIASADVNNDGYEDLYLGGGHTQAGRLLMGKGDGMVEVQGKNPFAVDKQKEDIGACFFDADNDGDLDLYVTSGSYEFREGSRLLEDRLYINDGNGIFSKSRGQLPMMATAGSVVKAADFDHDGDQDLFVGGRVVAGKYPYTPMSYLLVNQNGSFKIATQSLAEDLESIGMVTDASWADIDNDDDLDLLVTGEWMGIELFVNDGGQLIRSDNYPQLHESTGWWNTINLVDIDQDGDQDIVAGNLGLNYKFHASPEKPFHVYTNDFDYNGTVDIFLAKYYNEIEVPVRGKSCTAQQMPHLASKIGSYNEFANHALADIIGPGIKSALHYEAREFRSGIFYNEGSAGFSFTPFGNSVQQCLINSILAEDLDGDGIIDLLMAGNNHMSEIETTRADAGIGIFLKGKKDGGFNYMKFTDTGFFADGDVRHLCYLKMKEGAAVIVANNNSAHQYFDVTKRNKEL